MNARTNDIGGEWSVPKTLANAVATPLGDANGMMIYDNMNMNMNRINQDRVNVKGER